MESGRAPPPSSRSRLHASSPGTPRFHGLRFALRPSSIEAFACRFVASSSALPSFNPAVPAPQSEAPAPSRPMDLQLLPLPQPIRADSLHSSTHELLVLLAPLCWCPLPQLHHTDTCSFSSALLCCSARLVLCFALLQWCYYDIGSVWFGV